MRRVVEEGDEAAAKEMAMMGQNGKRRVQTEFTRTKMAQRLEDEIEEMIIAKRRAFIGWNEMLLGLSVIGVLVVSLVLVIKGSFE